MFPEEFPAFHLTEKAIEFDNEAVEFLPEQQEELRRWIQLVIENESCELKHLTYIFCSDAYLHNINLAYLSHDTYTDIITFPYEAPPLIHADIFISVERVRENAASLGLAFSRELHRVMIHGILHLCGYPDKTAQEAAEMRAREDEALALFDAE